jgi:hypothetical protein
MLVLLAATVAMAPSVASQSAPAGVTPIPFAEARQVLQALRDELLPETLRALTPAQREAQWTGWVKARDAAIRQRVTQGDEDSVVNLVFFGTTFTKRPRPSESELNALLTRPADGLAALRPRLDDFLTAVAAPGSDERLQIARRVIANAGLDPATGQGRDRLRRRLEERMLAVAAESAAVSTAVDAGNPSTTSTLFRERGLSSDTSLVVDYGVDNALGMVARIRSKDVPVRRVAIVGPGLDYADKLRGYDFYPPQTIQPFAVIDSVIHHGLGDAASLRVTAFDLSPQVLAHLAAARTRAMAGTSYGLVLPRSPDRMWTQGLVEYWRRLGSRVGVDGPAITPPATAGNVQARGVRVRPSVVLAVTPRDLNIVLARDERPASEKFDLVIATNILVYYDVFEQSLAVANVASMLAPGGLFLTNTRMTLLPGSPLRSVGYTDTVYTADPQGRGETGDRVYAYGR